MDKSFQEIAEKIKQHITERGWEDNPPRGLAISMLLEASELVEHYQWRDEPVGSTDELAEELADILIYAFQFADKYNIDIPKEIEKKLAKSAKKYPAENFKGRTAEQRKAAWLDAKLHYKKNGL